MGNGIPPEIWTRCRLSRGCNPEQAGLISSWEEVSLTASGTMYWECSRYKLYCSTWLIYGDGPPNSGLLGFLTGLSTKQESRNLPDGRRHRRNSHKVTVNCEVTAPDVEFIAHAGGARVGGGRAWPAPRPGRGWPRGRMTTPCGCGGSPTERSCASWRGTRMVCRAWPSAPTGRPWLRGRRTPPYACGASPMGHCCTCWGSTWGR